jgi:hypothetical protein
MTTTDWILDIVLVLIVVRQIREERLTARFVIVPAAIVFYTAHTYLHGLPSGGNDLVLVGAAAATGALLGLAGGLLTKIRAAGGHAYVRAGWAAAGLWVASMSARLGLIVWMTHSAGESTVARFSADHHITGADTWSTALVLLALSEVVVRIAVVVIRGRAAVATAPAVQLDKEPVAA